ncbi:MAG TPA: complex I NDUFA9 subunit family protein [Alphaproteobacteria bacterium]|jgi:NADH dehydrogenase|nr:complex I NDUFA9 subunit family protein [Alphaproteobacteria bacterium]
MAPRQVTVFGGSGFIGRYVVQRLARAGDRVAVAVRDTDGAQFLSMFGDVGQVMPVPCDVSMPATVAAALRGADAVVNLVGILRGSAARFDAVHHKGAGAIAEAARAAGVQRLVHISAIGADPNASSAYARSKGLGEEAVRTAFPEAAILRPSVVFGPEDDFFNRFARLARVAPVLPLFGGGRTKFQPVYVGDVADAVLAALLDKSARGRTFELGGPEVLSLADVFRIVLRETNRKRCMISVPFVAADLVGTLSPILHLPGRAPVITRDQAKLLRRDNVVGAGAAGLRDLGITPTALELIIPNYLSTYRKRGRL